MSSMGVTGRTSFDSRWDARVEVDPHRAVELQTPSQRRASQTVVERALGAGSAAVVLTGSTVRSRRTAASDLDLMIVGVRPDVSDLREDLDLYVASSSAFWERLVAGDDYIQWTLRFGLVLHDDGILRAGARHLEEAGIEPSAERKLAQARRGLRIARLVLESEDWEAAREQCRAALTTVARWLLIANGVFPLARDELSDQVLELGCFDLAAALDRLINAEPSEQELRADLEIAALVVSLPATRARRAALPR